MKIDSPLLSDLIGNPALILCALDLQCLSVRKKENNVIESEDTFCMAAF